MRVVGVILVVLAIVLGIVATEKYVNDSETRDKALNQLSLRADSSSRSYFITEVAEHDIHLRNDEILGVIASVLLILSFAMLSRPAGLNRHRHVNQTR
jgi:hypothetical protein